MDGPIAAMGAHGDHPFYPLGAPVKNYIANTMGPVTLVAIFAAGCGALFVPTALVASRVRPGLPFTELLIAFWFVLCGCIHLFFEGQSNFLVIILSIIITTHVIGLTWHRR